MNKYSYLKGKIAALTDKSKLEKGILKPKLIAVQAHLRAAIKLHPNDNDELNEQLNCALDEVEFLEGYLD